MAMGKIYQKARAHIKHEQKMAKEEVDRYRAVLRPDGFIIRTQKCKNAYAIYNSDWARVSKTMTLEELRAYMRDLRTK